MLKARKLGISTPVLYDVELEASTIYMEKVAGCSVKELLIRGMTEAGQAQRLFCLFFIFMMRMDCTARGLSFLHPSVYLMTQGCPQKNKSSAERSARCLL